MRTVGLFLLFALLVVAAPALAQRGGHRDGGSRGNGSYQVHGGPRLSHGNPRIGEGSRGGGEERRHFDGRRFDRDYRDRYFGRGRSFGFRPYVYGSGFRFFYGGFEYGYDVWPLGWGYSDGVYLDQDGDIVYLCNPYHPGYRIALSVVF
jgi:hypothetical protein